MITQDYLQEILDYNPTTGQFTWLKQVQRSVKIGQKAGALHESGSINIGIDGKRYSAQKLAWLHVTGEWPRCDIGHKNKNRQDNSFVNLFEKYREKAMMVFSEKKVVVENKNEFLCQFPRTYKQVTRF